MQDAKPTRERPMKGILDKEETAIVGEAFLVGSNSAENTFAVFFEDDGETGYFYALDEQHERPIVDALHIYNVKDVMDRHVPSKIQIAWSNDWRKSALIVNDYVHAVFDFDQKRGYCRTGFPPADKNWTSFEHDWSDEALELFR